MTEPYHAPIIHAEGAIGWVSNNHALEIGRFEDGSLYIATAKEGAPTMSLYELSASDVVAIRAFLDKEGE